MMNMELVAFVAIIFGTGLTGYIFYLIYKFFELLVNRKKGTELPSDIKSKLSELESNNLRMEKRIQNLETIVVDNDLESPQKSFGRSPDQSESGKLKNKLSNK